MAPNFTPSEFTPSDQGKSSVRQPEGLPTVLEGIVQSRFRHLDEIRARISHVDPLTLPRSERSLYDSLARPGTRFIMELSLIHISEPTRRHHVSRMPSSA